MTGVPNPPPPVAPPPVSQPQEAASRVSFSTSRGCTPLTNATDANMADDVATARDAGKLEVTLPMVITAVAAWGEQEFEASK